MKLKMVFGFLLFLISFFVFADTYPVVREYQVAEWGRYNTAQAACNAYLPHQDPYYGVALTCTLNWNSTVGVIRGSGDYYQTQVAIIAYDPSCPGGGTISGSNCINAPPCVAPQVRSLTTGMCAAQNCDKSICTGDQNPFSTNCKYANNVGIPINCTDGSTVNVPQVCPTNKWDYLFSPRQGESATCSDGSVIGYGSNCLDRFVSRAFNGEGKGMLAGAIFLGSMASRPVLTLVGTTMKMVFPIGVKTTGQELALTSGRTVVEARTASQAIANYIKANPTSAYTNSLKSAIASGAAGNTITVDPNTGEVISVCNTAAWSANQLSNAALAANGTAALPLSDIEPFINLGSNPWVEPAVEALQNDYRQVMAIPSQAPLNFPGATETLPNTIIIIDVGPGDTIPYPVPGPAPAPAPSPPPAPEYNPPIPVIQSDLPKYFDFLPTSNPFSFNLSFPTLPVSTCTYEIHQTVHVPFMGDHAFNIAPCEPLAPLRTVLAWVFSVLTIYTCIFVIFKSNW